MHVLQTIPRLFSCGLKLQGPFPRGTYLYLSLIAVSP